MPTTRGKRTTKHCPFCAELIKVEAIKCRFCGEFLKGEEELAVYRAAPRRMAEEVEEEYEEQEYEEEYEDEEEFDEEDGEEDDEEDLLYWGRPSLFAMIRWFVVSAILLAGCWAMVYLPLADWMDRLPRVDWSERQLLDVEQRLKDVGILAAGLVAVAVLLKAAALKSMYYEVSQDRIEFGRGILNRKVDNIDMFRVTDLNLRRSICDCIVGIGTISISSKDESDPKFTFYKVRQPRYLYDVLKKASLDADKKQRVLHMD